MGKRKRKQKRGEWKFEPIRIRNPKIQIKKKRKNPCPKR
jgi:hypothetical protein